MIDPALNKLCTIKVISNRQHSLAFVAHLTLMHFLNTLQRMLINYMVLRSLWDISVRAEHHDGESSSYEAISALADVMIL